MAIEIPQIRIHLAAEESAALVEPPSPYAWASFESKDSEDAGNRPQYLSPPATVSPRFLRQSSPLAPLRPTTGQGLENSQFQALLRSCREKNNVTRKPQDLRREVAIKAHQSKQLERRALFLSKVAQPPSPTAIATPITPPDSPSIFHCSLPSPGLVSPLAHFETLSTDPDCPLSTERKKWVEQVKYRVPPAKEIKSVRRHNGIPSLEEISARLNAQRERERAQVIFPSVEVTEEIQLHQSTRLPAFLKQSRQLSNGDMHTTTPTTRKRLSIGNVGRLHMPTCPVEVAAPVTKHKPPKTPIAPELEVTTIVVPFSTSASPVALSEYNLMAMNSREKRSADMLSRLRRRSAYVAASDANLPSKLYMESGAANSTKPASYGSLGRAARWKRNSAPADFRPLGGNDHPVLSIPGGF